MYVALKGRFMNSPGGSAGRNNVVYVKDDDIPGRN